MGHRELKRVPLDFNYPVNKTWEGYLNPNQYADNCAKSNGVGLNPATKQISDDFYDFNGKGTRWCNHITQDEVEFLVEKDRLWDFTRVPINKEQEGAVKNKIADGGNSWLPYNNSRMPTAKEVNKWNQKGMGHDAINRWILIETRAKRLGVWGECEHCDGEGSTWESEVIKEKYESWKEYDPPIGDGYQLWETVSEGSPISPVFESAELLAEWCESNATVFASEKLTKEQWLTQFHEDLEDGSMVISDSTGYFGSVAGKPTDD